MKESIVLLSAFLFQAFYLSAADPSAVCPIINAAQVTFITDDADCSIFYKCDWGVPYKYDCPTGLHFDTLLNICNYPELTNCGHNLNNVEDSNEDNSNNTGDDHADGECPEVDGEYVTLLPHSSDCSKFFICNEGTPVSAECPDNLLFNPHLLVCDYPENAGCGENSSSGGDNETDDNNVVDASEEQSNENNDSDDTENNDGEGNAVGVCPAVDGEYVTLLPHSSDCTKFFICNEGTPVLAECPGNLLFNPELLVCDYPENAGCGENSNNGGNNETDDNNVVDASEEQSNESNDSDDTESNGGEGNAVGVCPAVDGEYVTLLPHSSDCTKFFICNEGTPVLAECPGNLLFNPELLVCDYPENAGCGENSSNDGNNETDDNNVVDASEEQSNESNDNDDTENNDGGGNAVGVCPAVDGEYVTLLPHSSDCTKFFICNEGTPVLAECPGNLLFNPELLVCDYPENAGCGENSNNGGNNETDDNNVVDASDEEQSNENNNSDNTESDGGEGNAVGVCPAVDGEYVTLLPHSSDCTKFFICNEGTPVLAECPGNLLFNPNLLVCDYPENAGCGENANNDGNNETEDNNVVDASDEEQSTEDNDSNDTENNDGEGNAVGVCPAVDGEYVTLLPHSSDCTKFFICNEGTPVLAECPGNLLFNPDLLVCDYPENAGCGENANNDGNNETDDNNVVDASDEEQSTEDNDSNDTENNDGEGNAVGVCPAVDGEYVTLLPHSSDCTKFFICNEGTPVLAECPGNLLFNPDLLVCDYPENAGCGENSSNDGNNETDGNNVVDASDEEQSNENNDSDNTENNDGEGNAVGVCPAVDGEYVTLLPHSSDCTKFFICNEGAPVLAECPGNLLFNPNILVCDYPENADCQI